jgi:Flp pilus assembly protein TadG
MSLHTRARRDEQGAVAVEFALISMLLFLILFGIIQYGLYFWASQNGSSVAREALRRASVGACNDTELTTFVNSRISTASASRTFLDSTGSAVAAPGVAGGTVEVTVTFPTYNLHLPFVPVPDGPTATRTFQARLENNPTTYGPCA